MKKASTVLKFLNSWFIYFFKNLKELKNIFKNINLLLYTTVILNSKKIDFLNNHSILLLNISK